MAGLAALAAFAAIAASQFWEVRWTNFGGVDEWLFVSMNEQGLVSFPHANRPLAQLFSLPAAFLSPHGLAGFYYLDLAYYTLTAWLVFFLAKRLEPAAQSFAMLAGAFAVAWAPLDMSRLAIVQIPSQAAAAVTATLLAVVLFVESWCRARPLLLALALAVALVASRTYEGGLALIAGAPFVLPFLPRSAAENGMSFRRRLAWLVLWEAGVAVLILLAALPVLRGDAASSYQMSMHRLDAHPGRYLSRLLSQYALQLGPLVPSNGSELRHVGVLVAALVFLAVMIAMGRLRESATAPAPSRLRLAALAVLGLGLAAGGWALLLLSPNVIGATRTQFLSGPGIALFLAAATCLLGSWAKPRFQPVARIAVATAVMAVAAGHTLAMQREWDRISYFPKQRQCLQELFRLAPSLRPGTLLLLIDDDGAWPFVLTFRHAVRFFYGGSVTGYTLDGDPFLYALKAEPQGVRVTPWPVIQGPWHEAPTFYRYDETVVVRFAHGRMSLLPEWRDAHLPFLPPGARYAPLERIGAGPSPARKLALD